MRLDKHELRRELELPEDERVDETRTDEAIERALATLQRGHVNLQRDYDECVERLERGGDYLNYACIDTWHKAWYRS